MLATILAGFACSSSDVAERPATGPYVNVAHDETFTLQVRRDRIEQLEAMTYRVWIRWLWAEPRMWKGQEETALVVLADLDCGGLRLRELAQMHKNAAAEIYAVEEWEPDRAAWRSFDRSSGSGATLERLCEFVLELESADPSTASDRGVP